MEQALLPAAFDFGVSRQERLDFVIPRFTATGLSTVASQRHLRIQSGGMILAGKIRATNL